MKFKSLLSVKLPLFIIFIIMFLFNAFCGYVTIRLTSIDFIFPTVSGLIFFGSIFFIFLAIILLIGLNIYSIHKMELIINSTSLELKSITGAGSLIPRTSRPFVIEYESITKIKYSGIPTVWEIIDKNGKSTLLNPNIFEKNGGENILAELRAHLPEQCFEDGFKPFRPYDKKVDKVKAGIAITLMIILYFFLLFDTSVFLRSHLIHAWKVEETFNGFENAKQMVLDSNGGYWLLSQNFDQYFAYHWSEAGDEKKFKLPKLLQSEKPQFVSEDTSGNPIVWFDNKVMYFTGDWQTINYKNNLEVDYLNFTHSMIVHGPEAWTIVNGEDRTHLIHIDGFTGEWYDVPLPESAIENSLAPFQVRQIQSNSFLVLMDYQNKTSAYLFSKGSWQKPEYSLKTEGSETPMLVDVSMDTKDNLLVLRSDFSNSWVVEKISPLGVLESTDLPDPPTMDKYSDNYEKIYEDVYGRLWILGSYPYSINVLKPLWGDTALELELYTKKNSNFQGDLFDWPIMLPDGKLLSADDYVSSIDTTLAELPRPVPNWFANLNKQAISGFLAVISMLFSLSIMVKDRKNLKGEDKP